MNILSFGKSWSISSVPFSVGEHMDWSSNLKICVLLANICLYWPHVFAQEGSSLACGRLDSYTDSATGIEWMPDNNNISTGVLGTIPSLAQTLRFFPNGTRNCYYLDATTGDRYLLRGTFTYYNYDNTGQPPVFDVAVDATILFTVTTAMNDTQVNEVIVTAQTDHLNYCLLTRMWSPVISFLELRPLPISSYPEARNSSLNLVSRVDCGNSGRDIRFPDDALDRIWSKDAVGAEDSTAANGLMSIPDVAAAPASVLASARLADNITRHFQYEYAISITGNEDPFVVYLYFAELDNRTSLGDRVFDITMNGMTISSYDILDNAGALFAEVIEQYAVGPSQTITVALQATESSPEPPSLNAIEIYQAIRTANVTLSSDVEALTAVKNQFTLVEWSGDPCLPTPWEGVVCKMQNDMMTVSSLDLSNRSFTGSIPDSINFLGNLNQLLLANNEFNQLPELSNLLNLIILDLRYNILKGNLPDWLGELPSLSTLLLDHNRFSGAIPSNLADRNSTSNFTFTYFGNPLLTMPSRLRTRGSNVMKTFVGVSVGITVFLLSIIVTISACCYYKRRADIRRGFPTWTSDKSPGPTYVMKTPQEPAGLEMSSNDPQELSLKEVQTVTGKFKSRIGEGGFGAVYFGTLSDGSAVAVKVRSLNSNQGIREFTTELELLRQVRHENLVPLVGYCAQYQQQILIYPYMSNGSLHDRLYDKSIGRRPLDWQTRLNIVLGAARGLDFLHTGGERCIIHRDVKSSNILLDNSMKAKIADFGLSKYSPLDGDSFVSSEVRGTAGYLDPEYYLTRQLTEKSDVFSFGIVLLETVCGREPLNVQRPRGEWSLLEWVRPYIKDSNIQQIVDPDISQSYTPESLWRVLEIALQSVEPHSSRRPTINYIVRELEDAVIIENNASQYMASIQSLESLCLSSGETKDFTIKAPSTCPLTFPFEPSPVFSEIFSEPMDEPDPR